MKFYTPLLTISQTDHFRERSSQRGFTHVDIELLLDWSDTITEVGGGTCALTLSRRAQQYLDPEIRASKAAEKAGRSAVVVNGNTGITILGLEQRGSGHYRERPSKDGHPHRRRPSRRKQPGLAEPGTV